MNLGWVSLLICSLLIFPINTADVENNISFSQVVIDYQFNDYVTFEAVLQPPPDKDVIEEITIKIQPNGETIQTGAAILEEDGKVRFTYDFSQIKWHPFITVKFQFKIIYRNGDEFLSDPYSFFYEDNRFYWRTLSNEPFEIHYQDSDLQMGQMILNTALTGLQKIKTYLSGFPRTPIHIYAYKDPKDLQSALPNNFQAWVAGHTHPSLNLIMISAPSGPGLQLELERQIPHEIAHIMTYDMMGENFSNIPVWFSEGLATISEIYPNPDNQRILSSAIEADQLIPLESLCQTFPAEISDAYLAYAESGSFVNFLFMRYGTAGMQSLLLEYADGLSCEMGLFSLTGDSLSQIESQWRQQVLGIDTSKIVINNFAPYFAFLVIILLPLFSLMFFREQ